MSKPDAKKSEPKHPALVTINPIIFDLIFFNVYKQPIPYKALNPPPDITTLNFLFL